MLNVNHIFLTINYQKNMVKNHQKQDQSLQLIYGSQNDYQHRTKKFHKIFKKLKISRKKTSQILVSNHMCLYIFFFLIY